MGLVFADPVRPLVDNCLSREGSGQETEPNSLDASGLERFESGAGFEANRLLPGFAPESAPGWNVPCFYWLRRQSS
jgi:hypothetical protein